MDELTEQARALVARGATMADALAELRTAWLDMHGWADHGASARAATAAASRAYCTACSDMEGPE